ncbi:MAG: carbonic anhydrase [Mangrovibacterium sp.]
METYKNILLYNKSWAKTKKNNDKDYFKKLSAGQQPNYLWIGCSDSRVPAEEITGANPGDLFVHRNIANMAKADDLNFNSVLKYAVNFLRVKHIVICGHHGCGGVNAALNNLQDEHLTPWVKDIHKLYRTHILEFQSMSNEEHRLNFLAELNVLNQVDELSRNPIIQNAWKNKQSLFIHGWIFNLRTGEIDSIKEVNSPTLF